MGFAVDVGVLPAFVLAMALIELTPGPNLAYLALLSASRGRAAGLTAVAGITVGLTAWLALTLFGLTRTPLHAAAGLEVLRWVGVGYMLWLAYDALRPAPAGVSDRDLAHSPFARGLLSNLLNPKAALFYIALLPSFVSPSAGPVFVQVLVLGGVHILISVTIHTAAVFGAAEAAARLTPRGAVAFRVILAAGLVGTTLWLLTVPLSPGSTA